VSLATHYWDHYSLSQLVVRSFKLHLYLIGGLSLLSLIVQGTPTSAQTPKAVVIPRRSVATSVVSAASSNPPTAEVNFIQAPSIKMVQATGVTTTAVQTAVTSTSSTQVTSVSQLSDVQPTDWAFGALQSLIERYGVIAGYPDSTYRGNRSLTRYEFAAGLNAVLERLNELIATGLADKVSREDLAILQRLQSEFAAELTTLRGRVDTLEARTAGLEGNQFSTTTKLSGQVIFAVSAGGFSGERIISPTGAEIANDDPSATFIYRAAIDLDTSFSGQDLLKLRLDTVSARGNDNAAGFLEPNFGSALEFTARGTPDGEFRVSRFYYKFTPFRDVSLTIGPTLVTTDYVDINSYANGNGVDFSTLALTNNYILLPLNGPSAGVVLDWNPGQGPFKVRALYAAADAANPDSDNQIVGGVSSLTRLLYPDGGGNRGLFGDPYQGTVELEYSPSKAFALRLQYSGGNIFDGRFDVFGVNFELALNPRLGVFGRYGYGSYDNTAFGDLNPNYWMAGVSLRDLFVRSAFAGIAAGQPFIESDVGNATQTNFEAFYNFPVNDNIRVTPLVQVITNPANHDSNGTIVTGTLRTVFSF